MAIRVMPRLTGGIAMRKKDVKPICLHDYLIPFYFFTRLLLPMKILTYDAFQIVTLRKAKMGCFTNQLDFYSF